MQEAPSRGAGGNALPLHLRRGSGAKVRTEERRSEAAERRRARISASISRPMVDVGFVSRAELAARLSVSERTLRNWAKAGRVPEPKRLSERVVAYPADVARQIVKDLAEGSPA